MSCYVTRCCLFMFTPLLSYGILIDIYQSIDAFATIHLLQITVLHLDWLELDDCQECRKLVHD